MEMFYDCYPKKLRDVDGFLIKYRKNIEKFNHIYLKFIFSEPILFTLDLKNISGIPVTGSFYDTKRYVEWGPFDVYINDLPDGYYELNTKGVHFYDGRVLWEKSKWIEFKNLANSAANSQR